MVADHTRGATIAAIAGHVLANAPPRFWLFGYSMGGYVALTIMRKAPDRVAGLALLSTSARPDTPEQSERRRRQIAIARSEHFAAIPREQFPQLVHASRVTNQRLRSSCLAMAVECGAERYIRHQQAIIDRPDARSRLRDIRCPTLVLVGAADRITPPLFAYELAEGITGARLAVIPRCGHLAPLERPQALSAALVEWRDG